jgi:phosphohistidine phosphatase
VDVYVVRHAFASHADPAQWPDDSRRPLTKKGIAEFEEAARGLRTLVPTVDVVLSSGFARAWQTAEILHDTAGWPKPEECPALEAGRPVSGALDLLRGRTEESVALVGHEPFLSRLVSALCTGDEDALTLRLKKGGVVFLDGAELRWAVPPRILRGL